MGADSLLRAAMGLVREIQGSELYGAPARHDGRSFIKDERSNSPAVFISWAHSHRTWSQSQSTLWRESIATLASSLRQNFGIDADVDLFHLDESVDWTRYGQQGVINSDRVIVALSSAWAERWAGTNAPTEGAGAAREADALHGLFSRNQEEWQTKVLIALLPDADAADLPPELDRVARVRIDPSDLDTYEDLLRNLTGQPRYRKPALGLVPDLPPLDRGATVAALRAQLADVKNQGEMMRKDRSAEGQARREQLGVRVSALRGFIEVGMQDEE